MQGFVVLYHAAKGFGFIRNEAGDFFFHKNEVIGEVKRADDVSFWLDDSPRGHGLVATEVRRITSSALGENSNGNSW